MIQLIWAHGWGFDSTCFAPLVQSLPQYQHYFLEQGYFGKRSFPRIFLNSTAIGIGHSLGFSKLLQSDLPLTRIISLCGFYRFAATPNWPEGIPLRFLERMITKFKEAPSLVLKDFYDRSHAPWPPPSFYQKDLLLQDLQCLTTLQHDISHIKILGAIAATHDTITPLSMQQSLFKNLLVIPGAGHLPWIKNSDLCTEYLKALIQTQIVHDQTSHSSPL